MGFPRGRAPVRRSGGAIGARGFEPRTSPTRTARATRLRHAPNAARSLAVHRPVVPDRETRDERLERRLELEPAVARVGLEPVALDRLRPRRRPTRRARDGGRGSTPRSSTGSCPSATRRTSLLLAPARAERLVRSRVGPSYGSALVAPPAAPETAPPAAPVAPPTASPAAPVAPPTAPLAAPPAAPVAPPTAPPPAPVRRRRPPSRRLRPRTAAAPVDATPTASRDSSPVVGHPPHRPRRRRPR